MSPLIPPPPRDSVRAALEATFRQHAYDRTVRSTLWSRIKAWIADALADLFTQAQRSPRLAWMIVALLAAGAALAIARWIWLARQRQAAAGARSARHAAVADDPWRRAGALAAAGDFTAAAHALYAALLARLAHRERLALHPSKTAGDYARDLRAIGSRAFAPFREFARDYDRVVYGLGTCDDAQYARLLDAANRTLPLSTGPTPARRG